MAVSAGAANKVTKPARIGHGDVRGCSPVLSGTYPFEIGDELITGWHHHDLHQLEYAFEGVAQVETASARYLLPPQQAIWIPAGTDHCTTLTRVRTVSAFFDPALEVQAGERVRVLAVPAVIREMLLHAMHFTAAHQGEAITINDVCVPIGTSQRSLRRAFATEAGMPWRQYLLQSRLLQAMALLAQPTPNVLAVAMTVGFESMSGFTRSFRHYTGETPLTYRQRVLINHVAPAL